LSKSAFYGIGNIQVTINDCSVLKFLPLSCELSIVIGCHCHFLGEKCGDENIELFCTQFNSCVYSYGHRISSVILLSIQKKLVSLSFIVIMTDMKNFCDRNSVTHNKNQNTIG
jgi:hypothetical protein